MLAEIYIRDPHRKLTPHFEGIIESVQASGAPLVTHEKLGAHSDDERLEEVFGPDIAQTIREETLDAQRNFVEAPDYYDLLYSEEVADLELYRDFTKGCQNVLDCGVGTGRVAIPLAEDGIDVHGFDNSIPMLKQLQSRVAELGGDIADRVTSSNQDMRELEIPGNRKFDAAIISFGTLNFLEDEDDLDATFSSLAAALSSGGKVLIELSTNRVYREMIKQPFGFNMRSLQEVPVDLVEFGDFKMFSVDCDTRYDSGLRTIEQTRTFNFLDESGKQAHQRSFAWRNWLVEPKTVISSLSRAGFEDVNAFGDYALKRKYTSGHKFAVIVATLP